MVRWSKREPYGTAVRRESYRKKLFGWLHLKAGGGCFLQASVSSQYEITFIEVDRELWIRHA